MPMWKAAARRKDEKLKLVERIFLVTFLPVVFSFFSQRIEGEAG